MFSRPVAFVGGTRIFARAAPEDRQIVVYGMTVAIDEALAMVLPLPVPPRSTDDAVTFVSLDGYAAFFDDLDAAFPPDFSAMPFGQSRGYGAPERSKLVVHDVGMFEASFVPTRADFARLDPRFRLPERVLDGLPHYKDWGFVVCRLKPARKRERVHPIAFSFPRREPDALYFPTVHVHDGSVPRVAAFDHMLTCQAEGVLDATLPWTRSHGALGASVDAARSHGLVDARRAGRRVAIHGERTNADVVLRAPRGVAVADLRGEGETFAYDVRAESAYLEPPLDVMANAWSAAWHRTARDRLPTLAKTLREGLPALTAARREAWSLTALDARLPDHFVNGTQLWSGTSYTNGRPASAGGRGRVAMRIFTPHVEPQDIVLGFATLPDQDALDRIRAELGRLLDRACS